MQIYCFLSNEILHKMKIVVLFSLTILFSWQSLAQSIGGHVNYACLQDGEGKSYIEVFAKIPADGLRYMQTQDGSYESIVEVNILIEDDGKIIKNKTYKIGEIIPNDTITLDYYLVDLYRTYLPEGNYQFSYSLKDQYLKSNSVSLRTEIDTRISDSGAVFSDVIFVDTIMPNFSEKSVFTRGNLEILPNVLNTFADHHEKISFYLELYNSHELEEENLKVVYYLQDHANRKVSGSQKEMKVSNAKVLPIIGSFDNTELDVSDYYFVAELRNEEGEVLTSSYSQLHRISNEPISKEISDEAKKQKRAEFGRGLNFRTLEKYCIYTERRMGRTDGREMNTAIELGDTLRMQESFRGYWFSQDSVRPDSVWEAYYLEVQKVNRFFSTNLQEGFFTDRGRVYLEYGQPNQIWESQDDRMAYPYEIWHYHNIRGQNNRRFIFYNPTEVPNDFNLLHSDVIGELRNTMWKNILYRRVNTNLDPHRNQSPNFYGNHLDMDIMR